MPEAEGDTALDSGANVKKTTVRTRDAKGRPNKRIRMSLRTKKIRMSPKWMSAQRHHAKYHPYFVIRPNRTKENVGLGREIWRKGCHLYKKWMGAFQMCLEGSRNTDQGEG